MERPLAILAMNVAFLMHASAADTSKLVLPFAGDPGETLAETEIEPPAARGSGDLQAYRGRTSVPVPSSPLLTDTREVYFEERFDPGQLSDRLWYNADWKAEDGVLKRLDHGTGNTRIFLRDADYKNVVIRFHFRLGKAKDVRLMTGSGGHYNTVLHLRPDHFFLQTAKDISVPYFSFRHGECAYDFDPDQWYAMTIEFVGDEAIAHLDQEHLVRAKHPIIDRRRQYFAIQVDEHAAEFDNVAILTALPSTNAEGRAIVDAANGRFPVRKSLQDQFDICRTNAHEWYYQRDATYRQLVQQVDELDEARKRAFPSAFRTHKDFQKDIQDERKRLNKSDQRYKQLLSATHRSERAIDAWLVAQRPSIENVKGSRRKAFLAELRREFEGSAELVALVGKAKDAQTILEEAYPQLFVSDEAINETKKAAVDAVRKSPEYQRLSKARADAYRAQQEYLLTTDAELKRLKQRIDMSP